MASPDSWGNSTGAPGAQRDLPWGDSDRAALVAMMRSTSKQRGRTGYRRTVLRHADGS